MIKSSKVFDVFFIFKQYTVENLKIFFSQTTCRVYFIVLLTANSVLWLAARFIKNIIAQDMIALHYNVDFGVDFYGAAKYIYVIPALGSITILINIFLYLVLIRTNDSKFFVHILFTAALLVNVILATALLSIYLVNFT